MNNKDELRNKFTFWYSGSDNRKNMTKEDFEQNLKQIYSFRTIKEFWSIFLKLKLPSQITLFSKLFIFYNEIPPLWENSKNKNGGRIYFRILKDVADKVWQNLNLEFIMGNSEYSKYVNGIQIVKRNEDVIVFSIWLNNNNSNIVESVYDWLKYTIPFPDNLEIDYQDHPRNKFIEKTKYQ